MSKKRKNTKGQFNINQCSEGEPLTLKLQRVLETGAGIARIDENSYAGEYVLTADIRTDRHELAMDLMNQNDRKSIQDAKDLLAKKAQVEQDAKDLAEFRARGQEPKGLEGQSAQ